MRKLWVFGDSFMAWNKNWIQWLAKQYGCRVHMNAASGSSIDFTYLELLRWEHQIQKGDYVVIGISGEHRHYFSGIHFVPNYFVNENHKEVKVPHYPRTDSPEFKQVKSDAYVTYIKELYNIEHREKLARATIYYIINVISKRLLTDKVLILPTVYISGLNKQSTSNEIGSPMNLISMWHFNQDFLVKKKLVSPNDLSAAIKIMETPNHWLGDVHEDYEQEWHKFYDPIIMRYFQPPIGRSEPKVI